MSSGRAAARWKAAPCWLNTTPRLRRLTVHASTQTPHLLRRDLALILDLPESSVDVIAPDVGGGFGPKAYTYPEDEVVAWASVQTGRPVKWIEDRLEYIQADVQEREQVHDIEFGFDDQGRVLVLKDRFLSDTSAFVPWTVIVAILTITGIQGPYRIRHFKGVMEVTYTHRVPIAPVRGAGRPQATFVMERVMDRVAAALNLDPAEVRRRNLIQPEEFPYDVGLVSQDGNSLTYDSGDYPVLLGKALEAIGYQEYRKTSEADPKDNPERRYVGIGVSFNNEPTGLGPFEGAVVRLEPGGGIIVLTGTSPNGQGHETVLAQIIADILRVAPERVKVETGDTRNIPYGIGTFASRTAVTAANSVMLAGEALREKVLSFASTCLETSVEDLEMKNGQVFVRGTPDRSLSLGELATRSIGMPGVTLRDRKPGLSASEYYTPADPATACQACVVEVDARTGQGRILRHVIAHDCGRIMNPQTVEGQTHGSLVHGIGNALIEEVVFDENGTPLASTFLDYLLPLATDVPDIEIIHQESPSPFNPLGVREPARAG